MKKLFKKIIWSVKGGYKPKEFWDEWADEFIKDPWQQKIHSQHKWMLRKVQEVRPKTILEIGCGFGRNIKYLIENGINPKNIVGVDISSKMIEKAHIHIADRKVQLVVSNGQILPFDAKTFDVVLLHGVCMHVSPDKINQFIQEAVRVAKKFIIVIEQNYNGNEYTFVHSYKEMLNKLPLNIIEYHNNKKLGLDLVYAQVR